MVGEAFIFNEEYLLKNDKKRFILTKRNTHDFFSDLDQSNPAEDITVITHPLIALLFVLFDGSRSVNEVIKEYSNIVGVKDVYINNFVQDILKEVLEKKKGKYFEFADDFFYIPKDIIIRNRKRKQINININTRDFLIPKKDLDLKSLRTYSPLDCILEINFKCSTDCIYCYADRREHNQCSIPIGRLKEIIKEAKYIGMRTFDICGGELFLYDNWETIIKELLENGFKPYISTKIPISQQIIKKMKNAGLKEIQISLDSIKESELKKILGVDGSYLEKMIKTLKCLEKEGFKVFINSQITNLNDVPKNIKDMLDYFLNFNNIRSIKVGAVGNSLYRPPGNYAKISSTLYNIQKIEEIVKKYKERHNHIFINFSGYSTKDKFVDKFVEKEKKYSKRVRCSGNFFAFIILPDGKVTICEELYFHPKFIIGDLKKQSIEEMWNSERALELYRLPKEKIRKESACKTCSQFERCREIKGVCWKEILFAYGYENWDYPDPKCPYAPEPFNRFWLE
jgi:radical SAM protein with 4Fe4S-binding SPASM domain